MLAQDKVKIAVLVSGGGTNLQAIINSIYSGEITNAEIKLVISDRDKAYAIERAEQAGIANQIIAKKQIGEQVEFEKRLLNKLEEAEIELVVLAGFLSILSADFINSFKGRIINVHPSLLPAFGGKSYFGLRVHQAVLDSGVKVTGATVHYVNQLIDAGEIISQKAIEISEAEDTAEKLQARVMKECEWQILPQAVAKVAAEIAKEKELPLCYKVNQIEDILKADSYQGRGIIVGKSPNQQMAVIAYFIMGRSENSRNRIFKWENEELYTEVFDQSKVVDKSLIIYPAVQRVGKKLVVTNGDQTSTIVKAIVDNQDINSQLFKREFEPDAPNFTPRISAVLNLEETDFTYDISILKSIDEKGSATNCNSFHYPAQAGLGHFIHTYQKNGNPLPSFYGEPRRIAIVDDIDEMAHSIWKNLNIDNKISLFVQYIDLQSSEKSVRIFNKNQGAVCEN